ncbi:unnamed protein product [Parnassius apollo]|uniref:(apollo) hypothetical protein n=1 Tax=Parnassius apollo TaxID=110799 RepID=A0A8S3Y4E8_PARAO|nr:unnamed protein product [Parnassius apollo]
MPALSPIFEGAASSSGGVGVKAVSLSDVTAHITPTSATSPVSTAAKVTQVPSKTTPSEPDVAFPAVLKGSQKQRVPPPVPPRGSPKVKRGGGHSQTSSHDTKGDYHTLNISANDITKRKPFASSDDRFGFSGHDLKFKDSSACHVPKTVLNYSNKVPKVVAPNKFLNYVEDADSITERSNPGKGLIAQTTMMAKFNVDKIVREHLDSGDFDDVSFTESSEEETIVAVEVKDYGDESDDNKPKIKPSKSPLQFINRQKRKQIKARVSMDTQSIRSQSPDLTITSKTPNMPLQVHKELPKSPDKEESINKSFVKPGLISGLSKKFNFNQSRNDKIRDKEPKKIKPKIEIKTYSEEHSIVQNKIDVCHKKAQSKIDMFQKHIRRMQTDSENSSCRSSITSLEASRSRRRPPTVKRRVKVSETKKIFESGQNTHERTIPMHKRLYSPHITDVKPIVPKWTSGNVHDKIKKFTVVPVPETKIPPRLSVTAPLSCCSTPPPPFEEAPPARTSRTNSSSTTSSSASGRKRGASSAASVVTTSSASSLALTPAALSSARSNEASVCWTPPASVEGSTPTWTEGTPSFTESSSSEQGYPITPARGATPNDGRRSPRAPPPPARVAPPTTINCLTSEVLHLKEKVDKDYK